MPKLRKYHASSICIACKYPVVGNGTVLVTQADNGDQAEQSFLIHQDCEPTAIKYLPYENREPAAQLPANVPPDNPGK